MSLFADEFYGLDTSAKISAAINSLPPDGGIVDASRIQKISVPIQGHNEITDDFNSTIFVTKPVKLLLGAVNYTTSADPVFSLSANFSLVGVDRKATSLLTKNTGKLFELVGSKDSHIWPANGTGSPYFSIERMTLIGNGQSCIFDTSRGVRFNEGSIRIEDNIIKNFGSVALIFGKSVYYIMICNNYFDDNYGSIYLEYACDSHILNNRFLQGHDATDGPQIVIVAPNVRVSGNDFFGSDNSSEPDILLKPIGSSTDGGWVWVVDNKFGAERETFNPKRSRIAVGSLPKGHQIKPYIPESAPESPVSGPTTIRGNHFLGPGMMFLVGISRNKEKKLVTFITEPRHGIPFKG